MCASALPGRSAESARATRHELLDRIWRLKCASGPNPVPSYLAASLWWEGASTALQLAPCWPETAPLSDRLYTDHRLRYYSPDS
jgi:hypothetical protein